MRSVDEIRKNTNDIMTKSVSTGSAKDEQMRQLLANNIEMMAHVHDQLVDFKGFVKQYSEEADKVARSSIIIAITSVGIAIFTIIIQFYV